MATHSSILAWKIPWTEEPGGLQSMGLQRVTEVTEVTMHARTGCGLIIFFNFPKHRGKIVCVPKRLKMQY